MQSDNIPNKNLTGPEVLKCAVADFEAMLKRDCTFNPGIAYRRCANTLTATIDLGYPQQPVKGQVRTQQSETVERPVPLTPAPPDAERVVLGLERDVVLDNPNLARVHHDLPIVTQERMQPRPMNYDGALPGEPPPALTDPFPEVKNREFRYQKEGMPPLPPPVDRDVSDKKAAELGARPRHKTDGRERSRP